jgi:hypothetical protein
VPWHQAIQVLWDAPDLGLKLRTMADVAGQLRSDHV